MTRILLTGAWLLVVMGAASCGQIVCQALSEVRRRIWSDAQADKVRKNRIGWW